MLRRVRDSTATFLSIGYVCTVSRVSVISAAAHYYWGPSSSPLDPFSEEFSSFETGYCHLIKCRRYAGQAGRVTWEDILYIYVFSRTRPVSTAVAVTILTMRAKDLQMLPTMMAMTPPTSMNRCI